MDTTLSGIPLAVREQYDTWYAEHQAPLVVIYEELRQAAIDKHMEDYIASRDQTVWPGGQQSEVG